MRTLRITNGGVSVWAGSIERKFGEEVIHAELFQSMRAHYFSTRNRRINSDAYISPVLLMDQMNYDYWNVTTHSLPPDEVQTPDFVINFADITRNYRL